MLVHWVGEQVHSILVVDHSNLVAVHSIVAEDILAVGVDILAVLVAAIVLVALVVVAIDLAPLVVVAIDLVVGWDHIQDPAQAVVELLSSAVAVDSNCHCYRNTFCTGNSNQCTLQSGTSIRKDLKWKVQCAIKIDDEIDTFLVE